MSLDTIYFGVNLWVWMYLLSVLLFLCLVALWFVRTWIQKQYYLIRYPESVMRLIIHMPQNYFMIHYRLIPLDKMFNIGKCVYKYDDAAVKKYKDFFAQTDKTGIIDFEIDGKKYKFNPEKLNKSRWSSIPELHYAHNVSEPINFNLKSGQIETSASQRKELTENDLVSKLLSLRQEKLDHIILILIGVINLLVSLFILLKVFNVIKSSTGTG